LTVLASDAQQLLSTGFEFVSQQEVSVVAFANLRLSSGSKVPTSKPDVIAEANAEIGRTIAINGPIKA